VKKSMYALAVVLSVGSLWAADEFTGTWKLNPAKSKFAKGQEAKELTVVVTEQGGNSMVGVKGVAGDGKAISEKYSFPMKGGPVNYTEGGPPAGTSIVVKRVDANTAESTTTVSGKEAGTSRAVISKDGKTLTMTRKRMDDKSNSLSGTEVYERQ